MDAKGSKENNTILQFSLHGLEMLPGGCCFEKIDFLSKGYLWSFVARILYLVRIRICF